MANLFAKASKAAPSTAKNPKSETIWQVTDAAEASAISKYLDLNARAKELLVQADEQKALLTPLAHAMFVAAIAAHGVLPPSPIRFRNAAGESLTYVVQDCSRSFDVPDATVATLAADLGQDEAADLFDERVVFAFNPVVMMEPVADGSLDKTGQRVKIQEELARSVSDLVARMVKRGKLTPEQADSLINAKLTRTFKVGTFARIGEICNRMPSQIASFLGCLGGAMKRYLQA